MRRTSLFSIARCMLLLTAVVFSVPLTCFADEAASPDFKRDILPILETHCTYCHGPDGQQSDLRLDHSSRILVGGNSGPAIVPGKSADSLLIHAIHGSNGATKMPPESEGDELSEDEIKLLTAWIDAGAKAEGEPPFVIKRRTSDHWSFQPVRNPALPTPANADWVRNPIDAFILARLEKEKLTPAPQADRRSLIRRVSLDLTGLPPTAAEVEAFVNDTRSDAYEKLVDRLLASPHYGERWGRQWLDIARYADSNGYTIDSPRSIWKYRDWVIDAYNRDLPFDQFTIEQLAGDLIPSATVDQRIATGFHRNTMVNEEGGTDPEQFRVEAVVDRVSTTGAAWLGLTLGCARCHDHKYDPISQREFYQFFAVFDTVDEPDLFLPTDEQKNKLAEFDAQIAAAKSKLEKVDASATERQTAWETMLREQGEIAWTPLEPISVKSESGVALQVLEDRSILRKLDSKAPAKNETDDAYEITLRVPAMGKVSGVRLETLTHDSLPRLGPGLSDDGNFAVAEFSVARNQTGDKPPAPIKIEGGRADYEFVTAPLKNVLDGKRDTSWQVYSTKDSNKDRAAAFYFKDLLDTGDGFEITVRVSQVFDQPGYELGRFRISFTTNSPDALRFAPPVRKALEMVAAERTEEQNKMLADEFRMRDMDRIPVATELEKLEKDKKSYAQKVVTTLVMKERDEPRKTHIHVRGDFLRAGALVRAETPEVLPPMKHEGSRATRLDFARWLVSKENPLTARVTANRVWQHYFGQGLVATENDFGLQGDAPTHPELLDWLASYFMREGWSMKAIHRAIVTSATYRQSSKFRPELQNVDPYNKLLARQARLRLDAETIRDAALVACGLFSDKIGGPSVFPPQPEGLTQFTQTKRTWKASTGPDRFRRTMYTFLWRSNPYPFLKTFDGTDATSACTRRPRSNTPLQSLTMSNDPMFVELFQGLAARILANKEAKDDTSRLKNAYALCLSRTPTETEASQLLKYLNAERARFAAAPEESKRAAPPTFQDAAAPNAAAWTSLSRVLLNLDEFMTRE